MTPSASTPTGILRLHCPDTAGIVYHVSRFLFENGGNIIHAQQDREELDARFFMRVYFDRSAMKLTAEEIVAAFATLAAQYKMQYHFSFSERRKRMGIMVSKYSHCLYDLLLRHQYGELPCDIAVIVSNHADLGGVAEDFKVPFVHVPVEKGHKSAAEMKFLEIFQRQGVDFVVLARYMQILTPLLLEAYPNQIINIHHGFLPAFKGAKPYHQAYEKGVKLVGATAHYATEELDMGPIIDQDTIRVNHAHSAEDMAALGRDIERTVLANAVRAHAEDRIIVHKNRTIVFD